MDNTGINSVLVINALFNWITLFVLVVFPIYIIVLFRRVSRAATDMVKLQDEGNQLLERMVAALDERNVSPTNEAASREIERPPQA